MFDDLDKIFGNVQKDVNICKAVQSWTQQIALLRPFFKQAEKCMGVDEYDEQLRQSVMNSGREDGIELSVEETEEMVQAYKYIIGVLDIFDRNYDNWSEKGAIALVNRDNRKKDEGPNLRDLLGF